MRCCHISESRVLLDNSPRCQQLATARRRISGHGPWRFELTPFLGISLRAGQIMMCYLLIAKAKASWGWAVTHSALDINANARPKPRYHIRSNIYPRLTKPPMIVSCAFAYLVALSFFSIAVQISLLRCVSLALVGVVRMCMSIP
jgi:hypothetical protein